MQGERECRILDWGVIDYAKAYDFQKRVVREVICGQASDTLIVCEHPHVITLSRRFKKESLLVPVEEIKRQGIGIYYADRGGDVTYHGPGQIVLYFVFDLRHGNKDLGLFLRKLEHVVIKALRDNFGLNAYRKMHFTGVWVGSYKVASIGIGVRHWVTYHGLALNVKTDRKYFSLIRPCGMDVKMASINDFFDGGVTMDAVRDMLIESMADVFDLRIKAQARGVR